MTIGFPKPEPRARTKGRVKRQKAKTHAEIRQYVFARERDICRCCRRRKADSMHEMVSRGRRGKCSKANSIAVCGELVGTELCCHTLLQQYLIVVCGDTPNAEGVLVFFPRTQQAAEWIGIREGETIVSPPMIDMENAE